MPGERHSSESFPLSMQEQQISLKRQPVKIIGGLHDRHVYMCVRVYVCLFSWWYLMKYYLENNLQVFVPNFSELINDRPLERMIHSHLFKTVC